MCQHTTVRMLEENIPKGVKTNVKVKFIFTSWSWIEERKWMSLDWGEGLEGRAASTGLWGLPEEKQDKHLQTILQIGRNIIYMVQLYKSVTLGQLIFIL